MKAKPLTQRLALRCSQTSTTDCSKDRAQAKRRIERLEAYIRHTSEMFDICIYDVLKEKCVGCKCKRFNKEEQQ